MFMAARQDVCSKAIRYKEGSEFDSFIKEAEICLKLKYKNIIEIFGVQIDT